jgi:hypothetical protein
LVVDEIVVTVRSRGCGWLRSKNKLATNKPRDIRENVGQMGGSFRIKVIRTNKGVSIDTAGNVAAGAHELGREGQPLAAGKTLVPRR